MDDIDTLKEMLKTSISKHKQAMSKIPPNYGTTANKVIDKYGRHMKTFIGQPEHLIYIYNNGHWIEIDRDIILQDIQKITGMTHISKQYKQSAYDYIKTETLIPDETVNPYHIKGQMKYNGVIALCNGVYDTTNMTFKKGKHPDDFTIYKLPIEYDNNVDIKPIKEYVTNLVTTQWEPTVQEMLGRTLVGHHYLKKMFLLFGDTNTGKTSFAIILIKTVGEDNCSNLTLEDLSDPFTVTALSRKLLNVAPEISGTINIKNVGIIKSITGSDPLEKRMMHSQKTIKLYSVATNIFCINKIPKLSKNVVEKVDNAFYGRFQCIPFTNRLKKEDQDPHIVDKMTTETMKSAWFNYMLEGLKRLRDNNWNITNYQSPDDVIEIFNKGNVLGDIEEFSIISFNPNPDGYVFKSEAYNQYKNYMTSKNKICLDFNIFVKEFNKLCQHRIRAGTKVKNNKQTPIWKGIEWII